MKNLFKEAHKMTREMVKEYKVNYQAQFGLNISYLLEKAKEEKEMFEKKIVEELKELGISTEEIKDNEKILNKYDGVNRKFATKMYDDIGLRRAMKNKGMWDSKYSDKTAEERYLGNAECEVKNQRVWANYGKVRVYFDIVVDGEFKSTDHFINF